jgi:hypothetical protein
VTVAALFVESSGHYPALVGHENCWDEARDARLYPGPYPVVVHPPCTLFTNMAAVNWKRYGRQKPAWYPGGTDGGCFEFAWEAVKKWDGVLEHPAFTHAPGFQRQKPQVGSWQRYSMSRVWSSQAAWVTEVWQSAYGHRCRKRTWLFYAGQRPPFDLNWAQEPGTAQIGWFDRRLPTVSKKEAILSPLAFAKELVGLAEWSKGK